MICTPSPIRKMAARICLIALPLLSFVKLNVALDVVSSTYQLDTEYSSSTFFNGFDFFVVSPITSNVLAAPLRLLTWFRTKTRHMALSGMHSFHCVLGYTKVQTATKIRVQQLNRASYLPKMAHIWALIRPRSLIQMEPGETA